MCGRISHRDFRGFLLPYVGDFPTGVCGRFSHIRCGRFSHTGECFFCGTCEWRSVPFEEIKGGLFVEVWFIGQAPQRCDSSAITGKEAAFDLADESKMQEHAECD